MNSKVDGDNSTAEVITIPTTVVFLLHQLQTAGFEAAVVGGAVRDSLLASKLHGSIKAPLSLDWDLTTNATPEQIQALFPESFYENEFGTVGIDHENLLEQMKWSRPEVFKSLLSTPLTRSPRIIDIAQATKLHTSLSVQPQTTSTPTPSPTFKPYEITTYRSESLYSDHRRPSQLNWGASLEEDLQRRDFTINALALKIDLDHLNDSLATAQQNHAATIAITADNYQIVDLFQGLSHLEKQLLVTVGLPEQRFEEDALRMLRAIRFSVQLNMQIADQTFESLVQQAPSIKHISWERIRDELLKILASPFPAEGIELLDSSGLLEYILPEVQQGKNVQQGGHHTKDVWTHSLDALRECPSPDPIVRLATLLHDVGKPSTYQEQKNTITFYNHEVVGARIAKLVGRRLRLSQTEIDRLFILVRHHMFHYQASMTDAAIRRLMRHIGLENLDDMLDLREADRLGSGAKRTSWRLEELKQRMIDQLHQPMDVTDLAVNGHDLMMAFERPPGPWLGELLPWLLEQVLDQPESNTKNKLIELSKSRHL